jgi:PKHD-type hydroxylase
MEFKTVNDDGEFEITNIKPKTGSVIVFPSYVHHRVKPVTKGTRYSVVAWYGGPPFK